MRRYLGALAASLLIGFLGTHAARASVEEEQVAEEPAPARAWNEYDGQVLTARFGFGFLLDYAAYAQDEASREQNAWAPDLGLRDFRLLLKGKFNFAPRIRYTIGYMWDAPNDVWRFRQTGFIVDVPELDGSLFLGRTKEGFSTNKFMVGYDGFTMERAAANDAFLPILADGIRWTGRLFSGRLVYNAGWFTNSIARVQQTYVKNDHQAAARLVWLPNGGGDHDEGALLHLAVEGRWGDAKDGSFQFRSKPESYLAQSYAVDTGKIAAESSQTYGVEAYYRPGSLTLGGEYFFNSVRAQDNPLFHGGELVAAYLLTGEVRPYDPKSALFRAIAPARPVSEGGGGAWELVTRLSYVDLDSGPVQGGRFWRVTPMASWHFQDNSRLELAYGYGVLDRDGKQGATHFFQTRLQLAL